MSAERAAPPRAALVAFALLAACATPAPTIAPDRVPDARVLDLSVALASLDASVQSEEASRAASAVIGRADQLAADYRLVRPPQFHNLLVNLGFRERGLCCHFAEDLIATLLALELASLDVHWVVARYGSRLREHSSVVLAPHGREARSGLVLDAWRHGGELVWAQVDDDRYPWELHPMSGDWVRLHCR